MAEDPDSDANAELTYSITHESSIEYFSISSVTGEVFVKNLFDYEEVKFVNVTVTAEDNGIVRRSGSVSLIVYIKDANDNAPVVEKGQCTNLAAALAVDIPILVNVRIFFTSLLKLFVSYFGQIFKEE